MAITLHTHCLCHALPFGNEVENFMYKMQYSTVHPSSIAGAS